ncbi:NEAT domain-containing protein [Paracerasibacillus soli]|uniref:NEAT domain-containing protein n=1 Tax=Paracerasibacillus soli TaxID=480284 RepID=A0ABU5CYE5_9BACI|nr:NEAT domain-containing protein [Virgibacillus soli]MDY0410500.1 NEAT domain-containing protein [Virgibacillus soli]
MRKTFNIFLALLITVFTLPFSNNIVSAESSNGLKDGTYTMDYSVHYDGMDVDKYFKKPAILKVENGKNYVQLEHSDSYFILGITLPNGGDVDVISEDKENKTRVVGFNVSDLSQSLTIGMKMFYGSTHEVRVDFDLDSLVKVADEDNSDNEISNGTYTMDYSVHYDGMDVDKYFKKPAILKVENGKNYVQLEHSDSNFILGITLPNGGDVDVISEDKENKTRVVGFNVSDLSQPLTIGMKMFYGSTHEVRVDFDLDSLVKITEDDESNNPDEPEEPKEIEIKKGHENPVNGGDKVTISGDASTQLTLPEGLPAGTTLVINSVKDKEYVTNHKGYIVAGEVYEFNFSNLGDNPGKFELTMGYDTSKFKSKDVDIYYYNEAKGKWIEQNGIVKDGKITIHPTHFSTYGVFAKENVKGDSKEEKSTDIDYIVKHETKDEPSIANDFFIKPGKLVEKNGEKYIQVKVNGWNMFNSLTADKSNVNVIDENNDSAVIEIKIVGKLSDPIMLTMDMAYGGKHHARLILNPMKMIITTTIIKTRTITKTTTTKTITKTTTIIVIKVLIKLQNKTRIKHIQLITLLSMKPKIKYQQQMTFSESQVFY